MVYLIKKYFLFSAHKLIKPFFAAQKNGRKRFKNKTVGARTSGTLLTFCLFLNVSAFVVVSDSWVKRRVDETERLTHFEAILMPAGEKNTSF